MVALGVHQGCWDAAPVESLHLIDRTAGIKFSDPALDGAAVQSAVYTWSLRLQGAAAGSLHNCWLTEGVVPVSKSLYSL